MSQAVARAMRSSGTHASPVLCLSLSRSLIFSHLLPLLLLFAVSLCQSSQTHAAEQRAHDAPAGRDSVPLFRQPNPAAPSITFSIASGSRGRPPLSLDNPYQSLAMRNLLADADVDSDVEVDADEGGLVLGAPAARDLSAAHRRSRRLRRAAPAAAAGSEEGVWQAVGPSAGQHASASQQPPAATLAATQCKTLCLRAFVLQVRVRLARPAAPITPTALYSKAAIS